MKKGLISKLLIALLVVGLLFSILPSQQAQAATTVSTEAELRAALAGTETEIVLGADIALTSTLDVQRSVIIDGANHTITGPSGANQGVTVYANDVTIQNLTITGSGKSNLNFYVVTGGVLNNVTLANAANAGMIVNGSQVAISGVKTTNNAWGGINVDKGSGVTETPLLTVSNVTTHTSPTTGITPAIWVDSGNASYVSADGLYTVGQTPQGHLGFFDNAEFIKEFPVHNVNQNTDYTTIQAAINAATAGDKISVAEGTYIENLSINKAITLTGAGMELTTVVATDGNATTLTFATDGATVQGFHFTHVYTEAELTAWNFNNNGVTFNQGATGNTLKDSKVTLGRNGIYLNNTTGNILQGNLVENNRTGINLTNTVDGTKLLNNTIKDNWTLGIVYYSQGQMTDFSTLTISGNSFIDNWYSEILIKDAQVSTGTLNVTGNSFSDNPVTMTNNADAKWNEPGYGALKPVALGGSATMPTTPWPTLRIYDSPNVTLVHDNQVLVEFAFLQDAIDLATPGATIMVAPGTYTEDLTINKAITLQGPGFVETFDDPIDLDEWYVDRKDSGVFANGTFQGEKVLHQGIRAADHVADNFYNNQGRKIDINTSGPNQIVSIDLFVGEDWKTDQRGAGMWATGFNATNGVSAYPIVAFRNSATEPAGFYSFNYYAPGGWSLLRAAEASDYGKWHTMEFELIAGEGVKYYIDGEMFLTYADSATVSFGNVILNGVNFGEDYEIYWDNFGAHDTRINGEINISAGNVNLNGLMLSNPGDTQAVVIHSTAAGVNLSENLILEVGGKEFNQKVQAVYLQGGPDQVKFENNLFTRIHASDKSANGIFSGDTVSTDQAEGLIIKNNRFVNITSGSKGAYGILLNNKEGNPAAVIQGNLFSAVAGGWTHAIGMEGPTAGSIIEKNIFNELGNGGDHAAIFFEANPEYAATEIIGNQFLSTKYFSVAVHPNMGTVNPIIVEKNWWGKMAGPTIPLQLNAAANFDFEPWCANAECTEFLPAAVTIAPVDTGEPVVCGVTATSTIDIMVAGIPTATPVQGYQFRLNFDPSKTSIADIDKDIVNGSFIADGGMYMINYVDGTGNYVSEPTGIVEIAYTGFGPSTSVGDGKLVSVKLTHLGIGEAGNIEFTLSDLVLTDRDGFVIPADVETLPTILKLEPRVTNTTQNKGYCDLASAVADADANDNIQILVDIAVPAMVSVNKALTLDLNGKVATAATGINALEVTTGGALVIDDSDTAGTGKITGGNRAARVNSGGSLVLENGTLEGPGFDGVFVYNDGSSLTVNGGTITGLYYGISGNGSAIGQYAGAPTITVNGGTVQGGETAIFHPQAGLLKITGGTITGGSYNGIEMKGGDLVITGGTITTNAPFVATPAQTSDGNTQSGDAILIYNRAGYPGTMTVTISGEPVITSEHGYAMREYTFAGETSRTTLIDVTGGSFTGGLGTGNAGEAVTFVTLDDEVLKLTGGKYNTDPDAYTFAPYAGYFDSVDSWWKIGQIAGTIKWDKDQTGKVSEGDPIVTVNAAQDTITFDGNIAWYQANALAQGQYQGNWLGVEIYAPVGFDTSETTIYVFNQNLNWDANREDDVNDEADGNYIQLLVNPFWAMTYGSDEYVVTWKPGLTQTFTLEITPDSELMDPPAPIISSTDIQGYYLTGEEKEFNIAVENPTTGADYARWTFDYQVPGVLKADITKFEYFAPDLGTAGEWIDMGTRPEETYLECDLDAEVGNDSICGQFGWAPDGFGPAPAGFTGNSKFRITFANGFDAPLNFTVKLKGKENTGSAWQELQTYTGTMDVYTTPVITSTLAGPYLIGVPAPVTFTITNPNGLPGPFDLVLNLPEGTVVVIGGTTYSCTATGCVIPIPVDAVFPLTLEATITFPGALNAPVTGSLFDTLPDPDRLVAEFESPAAVVVLGTFDVSGVVTLQGRTTYVGVPLTLTGPAGFVYGPYLGTSNAAGAYGFTNVANATYTFTTNMPRYLNVRLALGKSFLVDKTLSLNPLHLFGGDVNQDNVIGLTDSGSVGTSWGSTIDPDANINGDGIVNIQDLAIVGGNYGLTSATAYGSWVPLP